MFRRITRIQPQLVTILFVITILLMFVHRTSSTVVDPDLWHEMALAREAWQIGRIPWHDSFSYQPTVYPSVHHEWGAGAIAYTASHYFGAAGIMGIKGLLSLGIAVMCWLTAKKRGVDFAAFGLLAILAIFLGDQGFSPVRAQLYSFLFVAILLRFLESDRAGGRRWIIPWLVMYVVWLNVHAGFLFGAVLFFLRWVECLARREPHMHLLATGIAMALLIAANPYGIHYYSYLWSATTMPRPSIAEWDSLWEAGTLHHGFAFAAACLLALYSVRARVGTSLDGFPLVLVTAVYSALHARMLPFFAIVWLSYVPSYLQHSMLGENLVLALHNRKPQWLVIWSAAIVALIVAITSARPWQLRVPGNHRPELGDLYYPVGAVDFLRDKGFQGNVMEPFDHGAYVAWKLHPRVKVAIDSRYEVAYPPGALQDNLVLYRAKEGWQSILTRHGTDGVLVPRRMPLEQTLSKIAEQGLKVADQDCHLAYRDDTFSLYLFNDALGDQPPVNREGEQIFGRFP